MMSYNSYYKRIYFLLAVISWLSLFPVDFIHYITDNRNVDLVITNSLRNGVLIFFVIMVFLYYRLEIHELGKVQFIQLLKRAFYTAIIIAIILALNILAIYFYTSKYLSSNFYIHNLLYHISIGLACIYLGNTYFVFRRMILYQKNKSLLILWKSFRYILLATIIFSFINIDQSSILFYLLIAPLAGLMIVLSLRLKWIAYLNFKLKWESIVYLIFILSTGLFIAFYLIDQSQGHTLIIDLTDHLFFKAILIFILFYSIISILVIIFNLPTTSVFEQKFDEVLNFQKLSNTIDIKKSEEDIYNTLIDSCKSTLYADGACLEIFDEQGNPKFYYRKMNKEELYKIKTALRKNNIKADKYPYINKNLFKIKYNKDIKDLNFKSFALIPLISHNGKIGNIYLISSIEDAFESEMIEIIKTYVNQAGISISNTRLINEVVENAIYKEELEIAKKVQRSLIPENINNLDNQLEVSTFSHSANEVGGDYYDYFSFGNNQYAFVIGDVSGKGTSAAFHMAQLKGIFQSLIQLHLRPEEFIIKANNALSRCLDKSSFITLTLVYIDLNRQIIETSRAGHCPTLYYDYKNNKAEYLKDDGLGLGIVRDESFDQYASKYTGNISYNDILFLYTDGIIETKNPGGEEFGYQRLKEFIFRNKDYDMHIINQNLINELLEFAQSDELDDDYSAMIIKFKN